MTTRQSRNLINSLTDKALAHDNQSMEDILNKLLEKQRKELTLRANDTLEEMLFQGIIECNSITNARRFMSKRLRIKNEVNYG